MPLISMTGFSRLERDVDGVLLRWELRSVNGRNLDLRLRLPSGFESLEHRLRTSAVATLSRGSVHAVLSAETSRGRGAVSIDKARLDALLEITDRLVSEGRAALPRADGLLAIKGVVDMGEDARGTELVDDHALDAAARCFEEALASLQAARAEEGSNLFRAVSNSVDRIAGLVQSARDDRSRAPVEMKRRIMDQASQIVDHAPDEQRLLQELALLAIRADIGEELDRLESHVRSARELLAKSEPVGRRFDFLAQEMNRESNTICSKSNAVSLTTIGLDLKVAVDQLREQVQNIE